MKFINIDTNEKPTDTSSVLVTGDFSKIKNDGREYILHVTPATFMFLAFTSELDLTKIKVCFDKVVTSSNLFQFTQIINSKLTNYAYFTLKPKGKNGYMLLDNNTNPFLCYRNLPNSMPISGSEVWVLVAEGDDFDYLFTDEKVVSQEQKQHTKYGTMIKEKLFDDTYIHYNLSGNKTSYKRVIFSFPSIANPPINFRYWEFSSRISDDDLVIAFCDWYGNFGTYMMKNDKREDISSYVRNVITEVYNQYVLEDSEVVFTGVSKGGWIANYFAQDFNVDQLWATVPQMDIEHSFSDVIKLNSSYRLNLIYFFKDDDMNKYRLDKLHGNYNQYVFSDLDNASDNNYGRKQEYDYAIIKRDEHNLVNRPTLNAWFPKGKSKETIVQTKLFKVNNNLNFNIKAQECTFTKEYRKYVPFINCGKTSLFGNMAFAPNKTFISDNNIDTIFPDFINYYDEDLQFKIYAEDYSLTAKLAQISKVEEERLVNFDVTSYITDIKYDDENLYFNYEVEVSGEHNVSSLNLIAGTIFYNKLGNELIGVKKFTKKVLAYKRLELHMYLVIDGYQVVVPFDFTKFTNNEQLKKNTNFEIKDKCLINLNMH